MCCLNAGDSPSKKKGVISENVSQITRNCGMVKTCSAMEKSYDRSSGKERLVSRRRELKKYLSSILPKKQIFWRDYTLNLWEKEQNN